MQGIKGFSRYMLVERNRWLDSPIRRDGRVREDHATMFRAGEPRRARGRLRRSAPPGRRPPAREPRLRPARGRECPRQLPGRLPRNAERLLRVPELHDGLRAATRLRGADPGHEGGWFAAAYRGPHETGVAYLISDTALPLRIAGAGSKPSSSARSSTWPQTRSGSSSSSPPDGGTAVLGPRLPTSWTSDAAGRHARCAGGRRIRVGRAACILVGRASSCPRRSAPFAALARPRPLLTQRPAARRRRSRAPGRDRPAVVFVANPTADDRRRRDLLAASGLERELWHDRAVGARGAPRSASAYTVSIYECRPPRPGGKGRHAPRGPLDARHRRRPLAQSAGAAARLGKERRRIVVIHEDGRSRSSSTRPASRSRARRTDRRPACGRGADLQANPGKADFVAVFERGRSTVLGSCQDTWRPDEDLDASSTGRMRCSTTTRRPRHLPGARARHTLGLQWRMGRPTRT